MNYKLLFLCAAVSLSAYDETVTVSAPKIKITDSFISVEETLSKKDQNLQLQLINDVSFIAAKDHHNKETVSFRGIKSRATNVIEDLIPVYRTTGGNIDFYYNYNLYRLSSNMLITPSSLGVASMGSDIELFSKRPKNEFEGEISTTISNHDDEQKLYVGSKQEDYYVQFFANRYDRKDYDLSGDFKATLEQPSRTRLNSDNNQISYELKSGFNLNDKDSFAIKYKNSKSDFGVEPNVYDNDFGFGYRRLTQKDLQSVYGYYDHINENFETSLRLYYDDYKDIYDFYTDNTYSTLLFPSSLYDDERKGIIGKIKFKEKSDELSFVVKYQEDEHIWKRDASPYIPKFVYGDFSSSIIGKKSFKDITLEGAITYKDFKPLKVDYDGDPSYTQSNSGAKDSALDYQTALNYLNGLNLFYISHSQTTRVPTMAEMFAFSSQNIINPDLKVESSKNFEIGYKRFLDFGLYSIALFHYDIKDKIEYLNNKFTNIDNAVHQGAEFRYENRYFDMHNFKLSYSYTVAKDQNDNLLELIPKNKLILEDKIDINKNYSANVQYIYIGKRKDDTSSGVQDLSSYSLTNFYLKRVFAKQFETTIGVKNIFDKNYQSAYGYPCSGRNIYGQIVYNF